MLTRLLLGFGLRQFSMHPANVLAIKQQVLKSDLAKLTQLSNRILRVEDPQMALQLLEKLNA
jgi:phosphotransferase system enzyme I (PtsI)